MTTGSPPHAGDGRLVSRLATSCVRELTLDQGAGGRRRSFRVGEAVKVRFTVGTAHDPRRVRGEAGGLAPVAEIEFFGPSGGDGP